MSRTRSAARRSAAPALRRTVAPGLLRSVPQVHAVLELPDTRQAASRHGRRLVTLLVRERLETLRRQVRSGAIGAADLDTAIAQLPAWIEREAASRTTSSMRSVINATGVILHTNLGRAVLPERAALRMTEKARTYTTLEYELKTGSRGSRSSHLDRVFDLLFPGKGFHVVNNNAAGVLLALNTLAEGKEVLVSRGELVEIGGSFRVPDVMRKSGCLLREVGTTNKTRLVDYERALSSKTGLILKVHPSNYRIVGFTAQATLKEVAALARRRKIPLLFDQGSGNLLDLARYGLRGEPTVQDALRDGADVVCFSGDKLLGGPQAGLIVGRRNLIESMRKNSLTRALRVDKVTYAALETVLWEHARGTAEADLPVLRMLTMPKEEVESRARRLMESIAAGNADALSLATVQGQSLSGGGSGPGEGVPTTLLAVSLRGESARGLESRLRRHSTPVIARIEEGRVLLDLRTVLPEQEPALLAALLEIASVTR
jgi:L-seryl-tRNA(Ser) seleniumtransferase